MVEPLRHRQTKGAETDMPGLPPPRHFPTLPRGSRCLRCLEGDPVGQEGPFQAPDPGCPSWVEGTKPLSRDHGASPSCAFWQQ